MKKIVKTTFIAACILAAGSAHAQWGSLTGILGVAKDAVMGGGGGYDVNGFVQKSQNLSDLTSRSLLALNAAFAADAELTQKRSALAAINQIADAKEKQTRLAQLYKAESAETKRMLDSGEFEQRVGTLDSEKKKLVGRALGNFLIGSLQAVSLAKDGQSILARAGVNPVELLNLLPVKDALPVLVQVGSDASGFVVGVIKLAKGANIDVPVVKADSNPVDLAF